MTDTARIGNYSIDHRHECEVHAVAAMATDAARTKYLEGVARHRGQKAADQLFADVWELMRKREAA